MPSEWRRWMSVLDEALHGPSGVDEIVCPHCGRCELRSVFRADARRIGWGAIWCECCNHEGLPLANERPGTHSYCPDGRAFVGRPRARVRTGEPC